MCTELKKLLVMEENMSLISKSIENINAQMEKQQTQRQAILKYIEGIIRENAVTMVELEGSPSGGMGSDSTTEMLAGESKGEWKSEVDKAFNRSKFKKVKMPIFNGKSPDSWLFRADRYFKIHNLTELEKMSVAIISFDGLTLDWYRSQDERQSFKSWDDLKQKMLTRFRMIRDGTLVGRFLTIKQETTVEEY
ncbi:transposon Tf2-1 polyprotein isoform X1 [Cucumis melo var. makuwa]|uniref:Transposon Tf2-1 polyprotein isoform X1 n=1 Tax=Cucumis melo var. makuwa TaxID=1194695 RepID=A0A5D3DJ67_CUCMM|nr:transposon Tf2-1 polyprotein isoform X1 [Cucumis melo var. makuwa]TYK23602.1 transposon Tf2-1 polyprotein isoform X1 [Cucumis melo var. makuwa]